MPCMQVLSHQPFYHSHPPASSVGMSDSELGSPNDPISPQESLIEDTSSNNGAESPLFGFPGYTMPPQRSRPSCAATMPASSYFTPSFSFSATPAGLSTGSTIPYTPVPPPPIYNQFTDSNAVLSANEAPLMTSHGIR